MARKAPAYFDHAATTPLDKRVLAAMTPFLDDDEMFGNASSRTHSFGTEAQAAVDLARRKIAQLLGAKVREIVLTSGATEANNLAISGSVLASTRKTKRRVTTCASEHLAVLDPVKNISRLDAEPVVLPVGSDGLLDLAKLETELRKGALLASIMWVNNETGVIQPIDKIAWMCKKHGCLLHVDATQAAGKLQIDLRKIPVSLLSISAHKFNGPKGCGALFIRAGTKIEPIVLGGGQEGGLRPGTLPVHQIVGMGEAAMIASKSVTTNVKAIVGLEKLILDQAGKIAGCKVNGNLKSKVPHIVNLSFANIRGSDLIPALAKDFALASGSACTSTKNEASHVLRAMGVTRTLAAASIRISMGISNSQAEVQRLCKAIASTVDRLRN